MKKVLLTTSAIVGLTAPVFAADPTAVSDQPYFHHAHPMTWSGSMSIALTNLSNNDSTSAINKGGKKNWMFSEIIGTAATDLEEVAVGHMSDGDGDEGRYSHASAYMAAAVVSINAHAGLSVAAGSAVEDVIDDYFGGSFSEAMDVMQEVLGNGGANGAAPAGSDYADLADDLAAFQAAQDAGAEGVETTSSINTSSAVYPIL